MTLLRWIKLLVMLAVPALGVIYAYQNVGIERDRVVPFKPFKAEYFEASQPGQAQNLVKIPLKEKITLINFWATWCPPCVEEFPAMLESQRRLEGQGFEVVFVSIDQKWEDVVAFQERFGLHVAPGRLYWDPEKKLASQWGSDKFPESYVVRKDGWVVEKIVGAQRWTRPAVMEYFEGLIHKF